MHKSLANKIRKRIKNSRISKAYYASERDTIRERVAMHFNTAIDSEADPTFDPAFVDKKFYGALPSGDQFLYKWDTDPEYRKSLLLSIATRFFTYWKDMGQVKNWMDMFEGDQETLKQKYVDVIVDRFEEGIQRAKLCKKNIVTTLYKFSDNAFQCTHIDAGTLWIYYGYYTYQQYWMRTIEPSSKGMAI